MDDSPAFYPPDYYYDDLSLKIPWLVWLILVYAMRHALFIVLGFLPTTRGTLDYLTEGVEPAFLLVNAIVAAVLIAAFRRRPEAGSTLRRLWFAGRRLLITALSLDVVLTLAYGWPALTDSTSNRGLLVIVQAGLAMAMLAYLLRSRLARDVFRSFPDKPTRPDDG